jgi:hypothetical protein
MRLDKQNGCGGLCIHVAIRVAASSISLFGPRQLLIEGVVRIVDWTGYKGSGKG